MLRQGFRRYLSRQASIEACGLVSETDRFSLVAMSVLALLCLVIGVVPGIFIDGLAPVIKAVVGARMPTQIGIDWLSIVPIEASRSSYNGLLLFLFICSAGGCAAWAIHRFASADLRRAPPGTAAIQNQVPQLNTVPVVLRSPFGAYSARRFSGPVSGSSSPPLAAFDPRAWSSTSRILFGK